MGLENTKTSFFKSLVSIIKNANNSIGALSFVIGITFLIASFINGVSLHGTTLTIDINDNPNKIITFLGIVYIIASIGTLLFKYIEGEKLFESRRSILDEVIRENKQRIENLQTKIKKAEADININTDTANNENPTNRTSDEKEKLDEQSNRYKNIIKDIQSIQSTNNYVVSQDSKIVSLNQIDKHIQELQAGVNKQIDRLSRSGTINLIIGLMTTLVAIGVLISLVLTSKASSFANTKDFLLYSIPRVSLALFIEIFSFFFLRLYKTNLEDVKYFHNERTNIDSKVIALKLFISLESNKLAGDVTKAFLSVERNFILKKDETTISVEQAKLNNQQEADILSKLIDIINKVKNK